MRPSILLVFSVIILAVIQTTDSFGQNKRTHSTEIIRIEQIICIGNKRTKEKIIIRELPFQQGDTLHLKDTSAVFERSRQNIFNTKLFNEISFKIARKQGISYILIIELKERWYLWPVPIFELADRNVNEWIIEQDADLSRINIGIDFKDKNFRGRNEQLKIKLQTGFTQKYEFDYQLPYIDKKKTTGLNFSISYSTNIQAAYATKNNKLTYLDTEQVIRRRFYTGFGFSKRNDLYLSQNLNSTYHSNWVGDTIVQLNQNYFSTNQNSQRYFEIIYSFSYDKRDFKYYAIEGHSSSFSLKKEGLGIFRDLNTFSVKGNHTRHYKLSDNLSFGNSISAQITAPVNKPYYNSKALGYKENFVRGYELYVIDGNYYVLNRQEIKYRAISITSNLENHLKIQQFNKIPLQIFLKLYYDVGWANDLNYAEINPELNNTLMLGYGASVDIVSYYDIVFRCEYSFNLLGENGFFIHFGTAL